MRLIDADKLEELCDIMAEKCDGIGESIWNQFRTVVEWCSTVDAVEVKKAYWKNAVHGASDSPHVRCSRCGEYFWRHFEKFPYCPNCGADMRKEANDGVR